MSGSNLETIKAIYHAFGTGELPELLDLLDEDLIWNMSENHPYADGNPYCGPEAVLTGVFARSMSEWSGFAVEIDDAVDAGDTIVAWGRYTGIYTRTSKEQNAQFAHVWKLRDGKVIRYQEYSDTLHLARVMETD